MSEPVFAIGDSHVRLFSYSSAFLPLYIGAGFDNCFLTESLAEATRAKLASNAARLPAEPTTLFVFGEPDVRFQIEDRFGTAALGSAAVERAVGRYVAALAAFREACPRSRIAVLSVIPSVRAPYNGLSEAYDRLLREAASQIGIRFIDIRPRLTDTSSGLLREEFNADQIHLSALALPHVLAEMDRAGLLAPDTPLEADFSWSYNYRIPVAPGFETRFWGDKARTAVADAALRLIATVEPQNTNWTVLECAEGYLAFGLLAAGFAVAQGIESDPRKRAMAERTARFIGGEASRVTFHESPAGICAASASHVLIHPWRDGGRVGLPRQFIDVVHSGIAGYAILSEDSIPAGISFDRLRVDRLGALGEGQQLFRIVTSGPRPST